MSYAERSQAFFLLQRGFDARQRAGSWATPRRAHSLPATVCTTSTRVRGGANVCSGRSAHYVRLPHRETSSDDGTLHGSLLHMDVAKLVRAPSRHRQRVGVARRVHGSPGVSYVPTRAPRSPHARRCARTSASSSVRADVGAGTARSGSGFVTSPLPCCIQPAPCCRPGVRWAHLARRASPLQGSPSVCREGTAARRARVTEQRRARVTEQRRARGSR